MSKLKQLDLKNLVKLEIPDDIVDKIRFLCKERPSVEWSGVLFYKIMKGTMQKPAALPDIKIMDILLMDIGTSGATEYNFDEEVVDFIMDHPNPEASDWLMGHIHSHNTMKVFFSSVDTDELITNCVNHNMYLSVIVNNYLDVIGKVVFVGTPVVENLGKHKFTCKDESGSPYTLIVTEEKVEEPPLVMLSYDCEIRMRQPKIKVADTFAQRLVHISSKKEREALTKKAQEDKKKRDEQLNKSFREGNKDWDGWNEKAKLLGSGKSNGSLFNGKPRYELTEREKNFLTGKQDAFDGHYGSGFNFSEDKIIESDYTESFEAQVEAFTCCVIRLGNDLGLDTIEDALEDLENAALNSSVITGAILNTYAPWYDKFFDDPAYSTPEKFIEVLDKVIENLSAYDTESFAYTILPPIIATLKNLGIRFEELLKQKSNNLTKVI